MFWPCSSEETENARLDLNHFMRRRMMADPDLLMISFSRIESTSATVGSGFFASSSGKTVGC